MEKNNYENLNTELKKLWNEERTTNFLNEIVDKIDVLKEIKSSDIISLYSEIG